MQVKTRAYGARLRWWLVPALVASLSLNVALFGGLYVAFGKLQLTRIFPLGMPLPPTPPLRDGALPNLVMIGDSRALLWNTTPFSPCLNITLIAEGGRASTQVRLVLSEHLPPRGAVAIVQVGINDLHPLRAFPEYGELIFTNLLANLDHVTDMLLANGNRVVLTTVFPPARVPLWRKPFWDARTPDFLARTNDHIRVLAQKPGVTLLDAHAVLVGDRGLIQDRYAAADFFLHLNAAGYAALNKALAPLLVDLYGAPAMAACREDEQPTH
jgi:lysophospholipase L1-like esterase